MNAEAANRANCGTSTWNRYGIEQEIIVDEPRAPRHLNSNVSFEATLLFTPGFKDRMIQGTPVQQDYDSVLTQ